MSNSPVLKIAVVGLGRIGYHYHIPRIKENPKFLLSAVVDPLPERGQEVCQKFAIPHSYTTLTELLEKEPLDAIVIASPTKFHAEQTIAALNKHVNVFCDKPAAMNLQELDAMIHAAEANNTCLTVYQPHRTLGPTIAAQKIIASGKLGKIYMLRRSVSGYYRRNDWQARHANGGGMLYNYGSHYIDQLLAVVGEDWKSIHAVTRTIASAGDADDVVKIVMETESNILLDIDINMAAALPSTPFMIYGQYGTARMAENDSWQLRYLIPSELPEIRMEEAMAYSVREYPHENLPWHEEYLPAQADAELSTFYDGCYRYFTHTGDPVVPIAETRRLVRAIDAAQAICYPSNPTE